ncbi:MAG: transcriptional repressor [Treponema sp.]
MEEKFTEIMAAFKDNGCRITVQRKQLLAAILNNPGCSCKELYYIARRANDGIGRATVYRMVRSLEDFGYIKKKTVSII